MLRTQFTQLYSVETLPTTSPMVGMRVFICKGFRQARVFFTQFTQFTQ